MEDTMQVVATEAEAVRHDPESDGCPTCCKCGSGMTAESVAAAKQKKSVGNAICKTCHNVSTMLYRNLEMPSCWYELDTNAKEDFFRRCAAQKANDPTAPLRYKMIRSQLVETLTKQKEVVSTQGVGGEFLPLEVYAAKGYNVDLIRNGCEKEIHPILGETYLLPIKRKDRAEINKEVEATVVAAESQAKKRKMPQEEAPKRVKGKQPDVQPTPLTQEQKELQKNLVDLTCLQTDSEDEAACAAAASKGKKEAAKLKAQERKDLRAQQKAAAQDHKKTLALAHKGMVVLPPICDRLSKNFQQMEKMKEQLTEETVTCLTEVHEKMTTWLSESQAALKKAASNKTLTKEDLGFENDKELSGQVKASQEAIRGLVENKKALKGGA